MKVIQLTLNQVTIVDNRDYPKVKDYPWCAQKTRYSYYAITTVKCPDGKWRRIYMHRLLMNVFDRLIEVDHRDRNGLNNRRKNLRRCTRGQNRVNSPKQHRQHRLSRYRSSRFKGVGWDNYKKKWKVGIRHTGRGWFLGYFTSEIDAAQAYNTKALELFGEFAYLNDIGTMKANA